MEYQAIRTYLDREPFRPLTVLGSGGQRYPIYNPEMAWLLAHRLYIALPPDRKPYPPEADVVVDLMLEHVIGVEEQQEVGAEVE